MRLIWSEHAFQDLRRINDYLKQHDKLAAIAALRATNIKATLLRRFPALGPPFDDETRCESVSRTPYVLVYTIRPQQIEINRVYDSRQDWQRRTDEG